MPRQPHSPLTPRACGVLLHPSSLPSRWGIGDLGAGARDFARSLGMAGQRYWQFLPLNPTSSAAGDSPYFSSSSQAGNPLLISLEDLAADGLLDSTALLPPLPSSAARVDFRVARERKLPLLRQAAARAAATESAAGDFRAFCAREAEWLDDHALFTALQERHPGSWLHWPEPLRRHHRGALETASGELAAGVTQEKWLQYFFDRQWRRLHATCAAAGVWLFGDMPIYVNYDSVDVWAAPEVYKLDGELRPRFESGVPPDYFSATGQLWRNPVYDWEVLQRDGFAWWHRRIATLLGRLDLLRIDHFRGLVQYWEVPAGSETAIHGTWQEVPASAFFDSLCRHFDPLPVVAEDLGTITPDVHELRDRYGFPGMVVLQFAFDGDPHNPYLPENHRENAVAYLGTHDNNTTRGWYEEELDDTARARIAPYLPAGGHEPVEAMIELLLSSAARTAVIAAQDLLRLPAAARMNTPGREAGNWDWQMTDEQYAQLPWNWLAARCKAHGRLPGALVAEPENPQ